jgi:hypothetical protein
MNRSRVRAPPVGFASLMTTSTRGVLYSPGIPRPTMFRPQRFARSRRLAPPRALRACFIALPCPGFSLQGLLPPFEPHHLVGGRYPRAVGVACLPVARRQQNVASTSGSCSRSESAVAAQAVKPARHSCPLLLFMLPRAFTRDLGSAIALPPLAALAVRCCVCPVPLTLSVSSIPDSLPLSPEALSRPSFAAFESVALLARPRRSGRTDQPR